MATQDEVRLIIKAVTDQAVKELKKLDGQMGKQLNTQKKTESSIGKLKTAWIAYAAAIAGAAVVVNKMIDAASSLQEQQNKFNVVFDDTTVSLEIATRAVEDLNERYAMSRREAYDYMGTLGNLLKAMGRTPEVAAQMSEQLVKLAADMGSFNEVTTDEALIALRSALVGETEPMRRFGVDVSVAALKIEAMNLGLKGNIEKMDQSTKMLLAYNIIMKKTTDQQGDMINTADSYANVSKKLDATMEDSAATLGEGMLPIAIALKQSLIELIGGVSNGLMLWQRAIDNVVYYWLYLQGSVQNVFLNIKLLALEAAKAISDPIVESINTIIGGLNKLPKVHIEEMEKMGEASLAYVEKEMELNELKLENLQEYHEQRQELLSADNEAKEEIEQTHQDNMLNIQKLINQKSAKEHKKKSAKEILEEQKKQKQLLADEIAFKKTQYQIDTELLRLKIENRGLDTSSYQQWSSFMMNSLDQNSRAQFRIWKAFAIQSTIITTAQAAMNAFNAMAGIPFVGPALGAVAAAATVAMGAVQVAKIAGTEFKGAEEGALIRGTPGATGSLIRAGEHGKDEAIIPLEDSDVMDRLSGGGVTVNFNVDTMVAGEDFPRETAMRIDDALYRLGQEGLRKS